MSKSTKRILCVVMIFSLLMTVCGAVCARGSGNDAKERVAIKTEWLRSTEKVVKKINDPEVNEVFNFLKKNTILASPDKKGVRFIEGGKSKSWVAIIPLTDRDTDIGELYVGRWRDIFLSSAVAHFFPGVRTIVIKDYVPYSSTTKAIIFLHEGYHAYTFIKNPYDQQSEEEYCNEEVRAHTFQNKIMDLLGGKKYQRVLEKEVKRITAGAVISKGKFGVPGCTKYNKDLSSIFSKPSSQREEKFIQTSVWINAVFVFLDKNFKGNVADQKAQFLRTIYEEDGMIR